MPSASRTSSMIGDLRATARRAPPPRRPVADAGAPCTTGSRPPGRPAASRRPSPRPAGSACGRVTSRAMKSSRPRTALTGVPSGRADRVGHPEEGAEVQRRGVEQHQPVGMRATPAACQRPGAASRRLDWVRMTRASPLARPPVTRPQGRRRGRRRRAARDARPRPALADRLRRAAAGAADLPGAARRRASRSWWRPRLEVPAVAGVAGVPASASRSWAGARPRTRTP